MIPSEIDRLITYLEGQVAALIILTRKAKGLQVSSPLAIGEKEIEIGKELREHGRKMIEVFGELMTF